MDLHVVGPLATPAERAAVDAILDPEIGPASGWTGGQRRIEAEGRIAHSGHAARSRRDLLLPALHALQARTDWVSQAGLNHICRRLTIPPAEAYGVATFYALLSTRPRPPAVVHVCDDIACRLAGAEELCERMEATRGPAGDAWSRSPCLGLCERAPVAFVTLAGEDERRLSLAPATTAGIEVVLEGGAPAASVPSFVRRAPDAAMSLLTRVGRVDASSLAAYRAAGGSVALARALRIGREHVLEEVTASGLVGRGGAAFPTGRKWAAVAAAKATPHYVVCNADESEPGTFKDRILLEEDPFAVVEAMTIAGYAVGAERGYLYIRGEYPLAEARVTDAIGQARAAGLLGPSLAGSDVAFDIEVRRGAGAYICGEETALFASIEGRRGEPRNKPPFPVEVGLFGQPTAVNNVETLANVLLIVGSDDGAERFAAIGGGSSRGPKLFCVSGHVARPGLYEVPFGATLGELIDLAGGVADGRGLKAVLLGGAAGAFVGPEALDTPLTLESVRAIGATLGSGVVMVFDERADLIDTLRRIAAFFRDESCGQCVPCRVGTVRQEEVLARLLRDRGSRPGATTELALLRDLGQVMRDASICGLGQTASSAIESVLARPGIMAP